ncbi:MAG: hypothetical protein LBF28_02335 [Rickettsiales bacterium]|nr:hypothetical protein [Rickettsiales bacterium]
MKKILILPLVLLSFSTFADDDKAMVSDALELIQNDTKWTLDQKMDLVRMICQKIQIYLKNKNSEIDMMFNDISDNGSTISENSYFFRQIDCKKDNFDKVADATFAISNYIRDSYYTIMNTDEKAQKGPDDKPRGKSDISIAEAANIFRISMAGQCERIGMTLPNKLKVTDTKVSCKSAVVANMFECDLHSNFSDGTKCTLSCNDVLISRAGSGAVFRSANCGNIMHTKQ